MTRDDIIRMYEKANGWSPAGWDKTVKELERFANLVAAAEREACAQIAHNTYEGFGVDAKGVDFVKERIIAAIRARGQV
jgi:hypothetical protein